MNTTAAIVALQNQAGQKDTIIGKLHEQIRDLTERLDQSCGERDQTIGQFEQNERIWKEKLERKQEECTQVLKLHSQLKEDNTDALFQIDKLVKRVRQLQGEQERATDESRKQSESLSTALDKNQTY